MRRALFQLAIVGFLCRALVPAGFMPAPLSEGGPIRFCHGGPAGALLASIADRRAFAAAERADGHDARNSIHEHAHAGADAATDGGHDAGHEGWDRCPVGAAFSFAVLAGEVALPLPVPARALLPSEARVHAPRAIPSGYHARAPPLV